MLADPPVQTEPIPQFPVCICYILCWSHQRYLLDRNTVSKDLDMLWYFVQFWNLRKNKIKENFN